MFGRRCVVPVGLTFPLVYHVIVILIVMIMVQSSSSLALVTMTPLVPNFMHPLPFICHGRDRSSLHMNFPRPSSEFKIDYQSDESMYGRGEMHLSAMLEEKDIVVYQTGTWEVDGAEVGDGTPSKFEYCAVETMQIVWTHNCEHGFVSGLAVTIDEMTGDVSVKNDPLEFVDFGPEQLVARLPVEWMNDEDAKLLVEFPKQLQN